LAKRLAKRGDRCVTPDEVRQIVREEIARYDEDRRTVQRAYADQGEAGSEDVSAIGTRERL
jgi:hypothetical protein